MWILQYRIVQETGQISYTTLRRDGVLLFNKGGVLFSGLLKRPFHLLLAPPY